MSRFEIELWTRDGERIADITHLAGGFYWTEERNEAETLQFSMDLDEFERYMINKVGADPVSNFREGQTEIKLKEDGEYLFGTRLYLAPIYLNNDGDVVLTVQADGYLNFFKDRYPDPGITYTNKEAVELFYTLVDHAQELEYLGVQYGNYGIITRPEGYYTTDKLRTRTYENYTSSTKLNMQRLTNLVDGNFDFKFLADKRLMTYPQIGSPRSDFRISFDRSNYRSTVNDATLNRGAHNLYNMVYGLGSGFGADQLLSMKIDTDSAYEFGLREFPVQFNEVTSTSVLSENTQAYLDRVKRLQRMPQITLSGANLPARRIEIGDILPVVMTGRRLLEDMTGYYRVERKETTVDENHFVKSMTLYFEKTEDYES